MKTLQISDGDLVPNRNTGILATVTDTAKAGQDAATAILCEFNSYFQRGNELLTSGIGYVSSLNGAMVSQYITEAINRTMAVQSVNGFDDRIVSIRQIKTQLVGLSTIVFFVEIEHSTGTNVSVVDMINQKPTSLNQLLDLSSASLV